MEATTNLITLKGWKPEQIIGEPSPGKHSNAGSGWRSCYKFPCGPLERKGMWLPKSHHLGKLTSNCARISFLGLIVFPVVKFPVQTDLNNEGGYLFK